MRAFYCSVDELIRPLISSDLSIVIVGLTSGKEGVSRLFG
jgi:hypothetical protein